MSNRHTSQSTLDINRSSNNPLEFKKIKKLTPFNSIGARIGYLIFIFFSPFFFIYSQ